MGDFVAVNQSETLVKPLKIALIGDGNSGKTQLINQLVSNSFNDKYLATIGVDFERVAFTPTDGQRMDLQIWDTAGQERFQTIVSSYYRNNSAFIIAVDLTDKNALDSLETYRGQVKKLAPTDTPILVVATKSDLSSQREYTFKQLQKKCEVLDLPDPLDSSAKNHDEAKKVFVTVVRMADEFVQSKKLQEVNTPAKSNNNSNQQEPLTENSAKDALKASLESYVLNAEKHPLNHGFVFFSKRQSDNRAANIALARKLVNAIEGGTGLSTLLNNNLSHRNGFGFAAFGGRHINSTTLNEALRQARKDEAALANPGKKNRFKCW
jgi:small GTP-binding protein